jgi:NADH:ubiquinone oxidoreductase subunit 4 (subunit M)
VYALRLFIRAMHNRAGSEVSSRELTLSDGAVLVPLIAVILVLALYPQLALHRSERSVKAAVASAQAALNPAPATLAEGLSSPALKATALQTAAAGGTSQAAAP